MSRDSNGDYSLPVGNPVVTATTITSTWANTTLEDIANALTDSLDRNGQGGMLSPLALPDGSVTEPSLTWTSEPSTGFYWAEAGKIGFAILGVQSLELSADRVIQMGTTPRFQLVETDAAADNQTWAMRVASEQYHIAAISDDGGTITKFFTVERTGTTVDEIQLDATALDFNGTLDVSGATNFQSTVVIAGEGTLADPSLSIAANLPVLELRDANASSNEKAWLFEVVAGDLTCVTDTDAGGAAVAWLTATRTGTTVDSLAFVATNATLNAVNLAQTVAENFTLTLTGFTAGTTGTVQAAKYRNAAGTFEVVTLTATADITGTSNSTGFGATGIPAAYRPNSSAWPMCVVVDNSTDNVTTAAHVSSAGAITFLTGSPLSTTGFTNSGSKGLSAGWTITYGRAL